MSNIAMQGGATGTGTVTILAPSTSTNRTLTLPDSAGTVATNEAIAAAGYTTPAGVLTQFNASGSAPVYACRAWVNFNGAGTPAIRASGNVSSIVDNGVGNYTVNFTTAMPDANYAQVIGIGDYAVAFNGLSALGISSNSSKTTTLTKIDLTGQTGAQYDFVEINVAIFR